LGSLTVAGAAQALRQLAAHLIPVYPGQLQSQPGT